MINQVRKNTKSLKNLEAAINKTGLEVCFFDKLRCGTHSKIGCAWFKKGTRTRIPYKLGFKYVYSAVSANRDNFSLILDKVKKECKQVFLNELAKKLTKQIIFVMNNAG